MCSSRTPDKQQSPGCRTGDRCLWGLDHSADQPSPQPNVRSLECTRWQYCLGCHRYLSLQAVRDGSPDRQCAIGDTGYPGDASAPCDASSRRGYCLARRARQPRRSHTGMGIRGDAYRYWDTLAPGDSGSATSLDGAIHGRADCAGIHSIRLGWLARVAYLSLSQGSETIPARALELTPV